MNRTRQRQSLLLLALLLALSFGATVWARDPFLMPKKMVPQECLRWYSLKFASPKDVSKWFETNKAALQKPYHFGTDLLGLRLWFRATAAQHERIQVLLEKLDRPTSQVLVKARIVRINRDAQKALGVRWSMGHVHSNTMSHGVLKNTRLEEVGEEGNLSVHLGTLPSGQTLDVVLQAMEEMGVGEILAKPRLIVSQGEEASIESGHKIPYQQRVGREETAVKFEKAVLGIKVKAKRLPGERIALDLQIHQDKPVAQKIGLAPSIETQVIHTHVVVQAGHTIVLGGIYESMETNGTVGIPVLSRLPIIGTLFCYRTHHSDRSELLLYLQPELVPV